MKLTNPETARHSGTRDRVGKGRSSYVEVAVGCDAEGDAEATEFIEQHDEEEGQGGEGFTYRIPVPNTNTGHVGDCNEGSS